MHFIFFLVILAFFEFIVADAEHLLDVQLVPSLYGDLHNYFVVAKCVTSDATSQIRFSDDYELKKNHGTFDLIELSLLEPKYCQEKYQIIVGMAPRNDPGHRTWPSNHLSKIYLDEQYKTLRIKFGNFFKLTISPAFFENSKMTYRVEIYCAGDQNHVEFSTFTNFATMVVFNSEQRKCEKYDIKVTPFYNAQNQMKRFGGGPLLVETDVAIINGNTHQIYFKNCFHLRIHPPLVPNSGQIYFVGVKCHGIGDENDKKYRTFTDETAQVVLNDENCAAYDIFVWRFINEMMNSGELSEELKGGKREFGVKIPNGHTYQFNFANEAQASTSNSNSEIKRIATDIDELRREVTQLKEDVDKIRDEVKTGMSEIKEFLTKKIKNK